MLRSKTATQLVLVLSLFAGAACTEAADAKPASGTGSHGTPQQCTSALEAVEALVQHGEVREPLLPFLWRSQELASLRKEDYGSVVQMLIDGGVLFEK